MENVYRAADNLFTAVDHLDRVIGDELTSQGIPLALSLAKRVRRESTLLIGQLAQERDNATAQEA